MNPLATFLEQARQTFWIIPALAVLVGIALGLSMPPLDHGVQLPEPVSFNGTAETARTLLQAITTLAVSIAGISFSVIVVALVLAAQQLSPRVLLSFQRSLLNQMALGTFLGTAIYAVIVLSSINENSDDPVPEASITLAMLLAAVTLIVFVFFLHHAVRSLNASAVIRRITVEGHQAVDKPYPAGAGDTPDDEEEARDEFERITREAPASTRMKAPRAGYVAAVEAASLVRAAAKADVFVRQRRAIGDFVVTGAELATVWFANPPDDEEREKTVKRLCDSFVLNEERAVDHDVAFPLRQLADVALRGLSPGINDPTTAENAMDSVTDTLARLARRAPVCDVRLDSEGVPRLWAARPHLDDLVRLGFDQVRRDGASRPSFAARLLELLAELRDAGDAEGSAEIAHQARMIRAGALEKATIDADRELIETTYERLHGGH